ncbi:MAG: DUF5652 family protein [Methanocellales archaeon]|nr:DUF5652 family protein [Methanocellales archaeon]
MEGIEMMESTFVALVLIAIVWELIWKGIALWKAARNDQRYWFVGLLVLNTLGILPILYIYVFQKGRKGI